MKRKALFRAFIIVCVFTVIAYAKGTVAGSIIKNIASASFFSKSINFTISSNLDKFVIDHIVDMDLLWQDSMTVPVGGGYRGVMLRFGLANLGNADDIFSIVYEHNATGSFSPPPENPRFWLDVDGDSLLNKTIDTLISSDVNLSADSNVTIFLLTDIVDGNYSANYVSKDGLRATSTSIETNSSDDKDLVDTTIRTSLKVAFGLYEIKDFWLESNKTLEILSDDNLTHTGSTLRYTIFEKIGGKTYHREIADMLIVDEIPEGTKYMPNSLYLDGVLLTDTNDSDAGEFNSTHIKVKVPMLADDDNISISFDVKVE